MQPRLTDERLAWIAVRDKISRKARRGGFLGRLLTRRVASRNLLMRDGKFVDSSDPGRDLANDKMGEYAFAVDDVAQRLNNDERRVLRATGKVPEWFLDAVIERYDEIRKS